MDSTRWTKVKAYFSLKGIPESVNDLKLGVRRSFLGLPRKEITELINLESNEFEVIIPNYQHDSVRNASLSLNDKLAIALVCHHLKPQTVIEIGTFRGETTDLIARNLKNASIFTLDLPPDFQSHQERPDISDLDVLQLRQPDFYVANSYASGSQVHQLYGDSAVFNFKELNQSFDMAFIDGAHSFEYVKNDTEKLIPLMNQGGWIIWDDYSFSFPDIIKYVNTFRDRGTFHIYGTKLAAMQVRV